MGQAEIRRYGGHSAADIERGAQRDEIRRKQERENHRERRCQKRKVRGVGEQDEAAFEQGKGGPCAGNYHLRSSESAGYQSLSVPPHGKSLPVLRILPPERLLARSLNSLRRINESSIPLWPPRTTTSRKIGKAWPRNGCGPDHESLSSSSEQLFVVSHGPL